jgi:L-fuconolactonase
VDKDTCSYRTLWNSFKRIAAKAGLTEEEKAEIFYGTAVRTYSLEPVGPRASSVGGGGDTARL